MGPSRSASVPTALLEGFKGYLMTDGYDGYNEVARTDGIERLACWAHVRRRFVEATRVQPKGKRGRADEAVSLIGKLYRIEREYKDAAPEERLLARKNQSVPVLAELHAWMITNTPLVTPKSALGDGFGLHGQFMVKACALYPRGVIYRLITTPLQFGHF
jgi:hypothetical protein